MSNSVRKLIPFLFLLVLRLSAFSQSWEFGGSEVQIRWTEKLPPEFDKSAFSVQLADHVLGANETVPELLEKNGINPNVDAFELIYQINPDLLSLNQISPGSHARLPIINPRIGGDRLRATLRVNSKLKADVVTGIGEFNRLLSARPNNGDASATQAAFLEIGRSLGALKSIIIGKIAPLGRICLVQLKSETELINELLGRFYDANGGLVESDTQEIEFVRSDLQLKLSGLLEVRDTGKLPERLSEAFVKVRTIRTDGSEVPNLRVWFSPEALYDATGSHESFSRVSSPAEESLPEADYIFWATEGSERTLVSEVLPKKIRKQPQDKPIEIDLQITH